MLIILLLRICGLQSPLYFQRLYNYFLLTIGKDPGGTLDRD